MMKKFISKTWYVFVLAILLSCQAEEALTYNTIYQSNEYTNKNPWKEDETFIKNVKEIFDKNAKERIQSRYGKAIWDHATSLNTFNESYLIAPMMKEGNVVSYVETRRIGNKIFFEFTENDKSTNDFFNNLIFTDKEKFSISENLSASNTPNSLPSNLKSGTIRVSQCKSVTKTFIVGTAPGDPSGPIESTYTYTVCKFVDVAVPADQCIGEYDENGNCAGGGDGGGYNYNPDPDDNPCNELKTTLQDPALLQVLNTLDNPNNFNLNHERTIIEKDNIYKEKPSSNCENFSYADPTAGCITKIIHTHQNFRCDENGNATIPVQGIPSAADIVSNIIRAGYLKEFCGLETTDFKGITISQNGTYIVNYNGASIVNLGNIDNWNTLYNKGIDDLINENKFSATDQEDFLMTFLKDQMKIDGVEIFKKEGDVINKIEYNETTNQTTKTPCPN